MVNETGEEVEDVKRRPPTEGASGRSGYARKRVSDEPAPDETSNASTSKSSSTPIVLGMTAVVLIGAALLWRARRPTLRSQITTAVQRFGQPKESLAVSLLKQAAVPIITSLVQRAARDQFGRSLDAPHSRTDATSTIPT